MGFGIQLYAKKSASGRAETAVSGNLARRADEHGRIGFWVAAVVAASLVGMSKGGVPVVGMLGVPVMALVMNPVLAAGLLLPVYVVSDMFGLYAYRHAFDRRVLAIMLPGAMVGITVGWATAIDRAGGGGDACWSG
jgi:hypothetical protein